MWGLGCLVSSVGCGVAWNTLFLGIVVGAGTTGLGLAFALIVTRTEFGAKQTLRVLTVLPIITPPFVIGLAVILLFGLAGAVTTFVEWVFGIPASRWIYGLPGVWLAQMLAFTPTAFLVLIGVAGGISPSMEEAAQALRANRWQTFTTVGTIVKAAYLGSHMEYTVDSVIGELFVVDPGVATPLAVGVKVAISFVEHSVTVVRR